MTPATPSRAPCRRAVRYLAPPAVLALGVAVGCQDLSSFSTSASKQYAGCVIAADFVLAGVSPDTQLCLTLDATNLQVAPGTITTTDGRFQATPLRPIPQLWHDALSTFTFGEGRTKNLLYMASPTADAGGGGDVTVVVSLLENGNVELRMLRGAPNLGQQDASGAAAPNVFAVFPLSMQRGACASLSAANCAPDAQ